MTLNSIAGAVLVAAVCIVLAGCQSGAPGTAPATAFSQTPIVATDVVVKANGLSCPLCASNIDSTLKKIPGVASVSIDLEKGEIRIGLTGGVRPSKARLAKAVKDAGFTVVSVN